MKKKIREPKNRIRESLIRDNDKNKRQNYQFIEKIKMEETDGVLHLQFKIKGLWGKNYKLIISEKNLTISVICQLNNNGKFISYSTSILLPHHVKTEKVWSDVSSGILYIMIPKRIGVEEDISLVIKDVNNIGWFDRNQFNKLLFKN